VATEVYLFLNFALVFSSMSFRFRILGPLHNVRRFVWCASHLKNFSKKYGTACFVWESDGNFKMAYDRFLSGTSAIEIILPVNRALILYDFSYHFCSVKQGDF
jgi:hypothetical protein